jgi:ferredoxin--NADP+ reductase
MSTANRTPPGDAPERPVQNPRVRLHRFEHGPVEVLEREQLAPNLQLLTVDAPVIASKLRPGQFVIVRAEEDGERVPLTAADWDPEAGTVSCVFLEIGTSTYKLSEVKVGDFLPTMVGPLGKAVDLEFDGTAVLAGGCYGIGAIYPAARTLKERGNRVITLLEARSAFLLYWRDKLERVSDRVIVSTKDGSAGEPGYCPAMVRTLLESGERVDRVIAIGCTFMMNQTAEATRPFGVRTIVNLNPIMIDGTGMCGACRVSVGGETKFACVDGPDFDGHAVDWDLLLTRRKAYLRSETDSAQR